MKVSSTHLINFAGFKEISVNFNDQVTYLVAPNASGKTTIGKTGFFFGLEGIAEKGTKYKGRSSFIGEWGNEAKSIIHLYDEKGKYVVERTMTDSGQKLKITTDTGEQLDQSWLNKLFKNLMVSPMDFTLLTPKQQAMELGIDTSEWDEKISEKKQEFTFINRELSAFGDIEIPEKAERVDVSELNRQKNEAIAHNNVQMDRERAIQNQKQRIDSCEREVERLNQELQIAMVALENRRKELAQLPEPELLKSTAGFDKVMEELDKQNELAVKYEQAVEKSRQKEEKRAELEANKAAQKQLQSEKTAYLQSLNLPSSQMTIDDDGGLMLDGRPISEQYFSSGQLLKIVPQIIAHLQPEWKYLFIQQFDLLDEDNQKEIVDILLGMGFQLVIEKVGKKMEGENVILLQDKIAS